MNAKSKDFESYIFNSNTMDNILLSNWNYDTLADYKDQIVQIHSTLFILIEKGELELEINHQKYRIKDQRILLLSFGHYLKLINVSKDFQSTTLYIRKAFADQMYTADMIYKRTKYGIKMYKNPEFKLEPSEFKILNARKKLIKEAVSAKNHLYQQELSLNALRIFFLDLTNIIEQKQQDLNESKLNMEEIYFQKFLDLIQEHFKEEHAVDYYASRINITPHYLTIIVKRLTGETVSEFIYSLLFSEAKNLLKEPKKTIQQISDELFFSDQSAFGKFFKRKSSLSPKQYKASITQHE